MSDPKCLKFEWRDSRGQKQRSVSNFNGPYFQNRLELKANLLHVFMIWINLSEKLFSAKSERVTSYIFGKLVDLARNDSACEFLKVIVQNQSTLLLFPSPVSSSSPIADMFEPLFDVLLYCCVRGIFPWCFDSSWKYANIYVLLWVSNIFCHISKDLRATTS